MAGPFADTLKEKLPEALSAYEFTVNILITLGIGALAFLLIAYYVWLRKLKDPVLNFVRPDPTKPRFRKREKVMFYGRKMLRRVQSFAKKNIPVGANRRSKKSKEVLKLAKKLLTRFRREKQPQPIRHREPPPAYLEVDWPPELERSDHRLPAEVMYMLRSVRVLGHFEKPIFLELCRFMESRYIPSGSFLFKIGDLDDSIYVVQSGKINVYITDQDGKDHCVKEVCKGDSIHSLLSVLDVLTGHTSPYKTVSAIAQVDSTILRLPAKAFQLVLERFPESLVRVVQIIMVRLQRVTFMALHNYLGLSYELINPANQADRTFSVLSIGVSPNGSPMKINREHARAAQSSSGSDERVTRVVNYDEDEEEETVIEDIRCLSAVDEFKKKSAQPRRHSEPVTEGKKNSSELGNEPSDFDVACARARVVSSAEDPILSGSPPVRQLSDEQKMAADSASSGAHRSPSGRPMSHRRMMSAPPEATSDLQPGLSKPALKRHLSTEELIQQRTNRKPGKRAVVTDHVTIQHIPNDPSAWDSQAQTLDDEQILHLAMQDISKVFGLEDDDLLIGRCYLRYVKTGVTLVKQGDPDSSLYFVVTGQLQVQQQVVGNEAEQRTVMVVQPGDIIGQLAVLTGEPSFFTIRSLCECILVSISKQHFYAIMKQQPKIVLNVGHAVVKRMSAFVRQIDFALDWMLIEAGRALFRQNDKSDCIYIILNGRLRSVVSLLSGKKELVGEYGRGELVGIVEVLTQTERATTMMAVRDTELAQIPDELLNLIKRKYPQIVTRLIHLLGQRLLGSLQNRPNIPSILSEHPNMEPRPTVANLATVAILPVADDMPLTNFTMELQHAALAIGPTLRLTSDVIKNRLGASALDGVNEYRLSSWLGQQEDIHRMVLYQCDTRMTTWTQKCVRQADCILIVALASQEPKVGLVEKQLETMAVRAQKELILLHKEDGDTKPCKTVEWLNLRDWCSSHHHIRCHKRLFSTRAQARQMDMYRKLFETPPDRMSDFSRLARFLTGTAIGLVLGGGGARGCAHVGMIRAMYEAGVPIDIIGGTSIGSFMGALWADELNTTRFTQRAREFSMDMNRLWDKVMDLTYPATSMFKGAAFNRAINKVFKDRQVEDLWIPYFCITTDITASKMRVHTNGSLWRYVRASMSLSGYLPPLCDPIDGHLLLDGGYVNNLPADVMKVMGAQTIFAVDVGSQDETALTNYGDELSGWWILWNRWNPWGKPVKVPNMAEIQSRLAYVSCVRQMEQVKTGGCCEYIRPPIDKYATLQFGSFDDIHDVGYNHGKTLLGAWAKSDIIRDLFNEKSHERMKPVLHKTIVPAEANFTDLAELISRIDSSPDLRDTTKFYISDGEEDDEEEEEERISVTSEPLPVAALRSGVRRRTRTGSEGATPGSTPSDDFQDPLDEEDEEDEDDEEEQEEDSSIPPGSPPKVISSSGAMNRVQRSILQRK